MISTRPQALIPNHNDMDDKRTDAQPMELSARPTGASDALQLGPADLADDLSVSKPVIPHLPRKTVAGLDAKLFEALVAPQAPLTLGAPVAEVGSPVVGSPSETESALPIEASAPIKMVQSGVSIISETNVTDIDWEPLPPHMWIGPTPDAQSADEVSAADPESEADWVIPGDFAALNVNPFSQLEVPIEPRKFYDPAAIDPEVTTDPQSIPEPLLDSPVDLEADTQIDVVVADDDADADNASVIDTEVKPDIDSPVLEEQATVYQGCTGAWWSIPMLCAGIAIAACALLVPAADENRRVSHELAQIEQDVAYFERQSEVNKEFLERVSTDPTLAERLAMRQLRLTRADARIVDVPQKRDAFRMSPYALVALDPPSALPAYRPLGGFLTKYFLETKGQIYLAGLGVLLAAAGVILGGGNVRNVECQVANVE